MGHRLVSTALLAVLAACSAPPAGPTLPQGASARGPSPRAKNIGGVIKVPFFNVPVGETDHVTSNLTVVATDGVAIDGNLLVPQGTRVVFLTSDFELTGTITYNGQLAEPGSQPERDAISACKVRIEPGSITVPPGDALLITASKGSASKCAVSIDGTITMTQGSSGVAAHPAGQKGGYIAIGSSRAVSVTELLASKVGVDWKAYAPFQVSLTQPLVAGSGGAGRDDSDGKLTRGTYAFRPGDGGDGGDVEITSRFLSQMLPGGGRVVIQAGNGGVGGGAGTTTWDGTKANGTKAAPNAIPIALKQSAGGNGGNIVIKGSDDAANRKYQLAGNGSSPGPIGNVKGLGGPIFAAGDGYAPGLYNSPTLPGIGGSFTLTLGKLGAGGSGGGDPSNPPTDGTYPAIQISGGDAGGYSAYYKDPSAAPSGATGGSFTLIRPPGVQGNAFATAGKLHINLIAFGVGGSGASGTCQTSSGGNGGGGGALHDAGLFAFMTLDHIYNGSFTGNNGGNGAPGGNGGAGGKDDEGAQVGANGANGTTC